MAVRMLKTKALNESLIKELVDVDVYRISHLVLLDGIQVNENTTWNDIKSFIKKNAIASRTDNLETSNTLTATYMNHIDGDITGAAVILNGNTDISQNQGTYPDDQQTGDEIVAWVVNFQPIKKVDWDNFTVRLRIF